MKTKERWTKCPTTKSDIYVEMTCVLTEKSAFVTNKMRKNSVNNIIPALTSVLSRKSVHEFSPPADGRHNVRPRREPIPKRSLAFNGKIEKLGISDDVPESKGSYWFSGRNVRKSRPFECNGLRDFKGGWSPKKRGVPKNAGISDDMYENKGQKNSDRGYPTMFMKTGNLTVLSDDIDENKPLNTRSALAQRAMLRFRRQQPVRRDARRPCAAGSGVARASLPAPETSPGWPMPRLGGGSAALRYNQGSDLSFRSAAFLCCH